MPTNGEVKAKLLALMIDQCSKTTLVTDFTDNVINTFPSADRPQAKNLFDEVFVFEFVPAGARVKGNSFTACPAKPKPKTRSLSAKKKESALPAISNRSKKLLKDALKNDTVAKKSEIVDTIDEKTPSHLTQEDIELAFDGLRKTMEEHVAVAGIFEMTDLFKVEATTNKDGNPELKFTPRKALRDACATNIAHKDLQTEKKPAKKKTTKKKS